MGTGGGAGTGGATGTGGTTGTGGVGGTSGRAGAAGQAGRDASGGAPDAAVDADASDTSSDAPFDSPADVSCGDTASDPQNCGFCGHDCQNGDCVAGECQPWLVILGTSPTDVLATDEDVWASDAGAGIIFRNSRAGGPSIFATGFPDASFMAIDATHLYWTVFRDPGQIIRKPLAGGSTEIFQANLVEPLGIAVDTTHVYFTSTTQGVFRIPIGGGAPEQLVLPAFTATPSGLALDDSKLIWSNAGNDTLGRYDIGLGMVTTFATGQVDPAGVAAHAGLIFWANEALPVGDAGSAGTITSKPAVGVATPVVEVSGRNRPYGVSVDDTTIYWTEPGRGRVLAVAR